MRRDLLSRTRLVSIFAAIAMAWTWQDSAPALAQEKKSPQVIPHAQDTPPNEPRDPQMAAKMMTVPEGFSVEVVAAEPDIVNPVAMTIDERGRFWITESLEYPRKAPGPGKDRVKILEDTDGDGKCDKFTVFLDGLNIPSGIAVGHGGVWIANSPDILFVPDADRDGKPDGPPQVVVTGFGRTDTHELPNSLTWGPDGWLYGLNGVFNFSKVTYPPDSPWLKSVADASRVGQKDGDKDTRTRDASTTPRTEFTFTCAMFRIHPRTREFQIFAEGTSNPWGIAFNDEGEAFISACVIDHLWHIVETGYYHRQGGPYPPFTWKIDSIVKHKHQKAAYCGIHYFDSDAYPEQYRGKLYMGNIHGGCINVDKLQRDGSTYFATGEPDFLTANDAWFMPVVQKTGPDGCLYILDWYDRYHCYQDANRDPTGIDRLKGRLYRVRYNGTSRSHARQSVGEVEKPRADPKTKSNAPRSGERGYEGGRVYPQMDLAKETDEQLIERLGANNDFIRWTATRLLQERAAKEVPPAKDEVEVVRPKLRAVFSKSNQDASTHQLRHAFFAMIGSYSSESDNFDVIRDLGVTDLHPKFDKCMSAWWVRYMHGNRALAESFAPYRNKQNLAGTTSTETSTVMLQEIIGLAKLPITATAKMDGFLWHLSQSKDDKLIPHIVWQNLHPNFEQHTNEFLKALQDGQYLKSKPVADLMPRVAERILGRQKFDAQPIGKLFALLRDDHPPVGRQVLEVISAKVQSGELKGEKLDQLKAALAEPLTPLLNSGVSHPLGGDAALLAVSWGDRRGLSQVRKTFATRGLAPELRLKALNALISAKDEDLLEILGKVLEEFEKEGRSNGSDGQQSKKDGRQYEKDGRQYEKDGRQYSLSTGEDRLKDGHVLISTGESCLKGCQVLLKSDDFCLTDSNILLKSDDFSQSDRQLCLKEHKVTPPERQICLLETGTVSVANPKNALSLEHKAQILAALGKMDDPRVAELVLARYPQLQPELQPAAIELLTQRASWAKQLLSQVGEKKIAATAINVNQARRIQALKDKELNDLLGRHWGQVRDTRNPDREKVVAEMKSLIRQKPGDPFAGEKVFKRVCAACHKIHGEGPDIGPDITSNGRNDFNQLLSNVFDPSLVIGAGYRVCTVVNKAGRVQSGLLVEDSSQRVVLKPAAVAPAKSGTSDVPVTVAVGKLEIIPRDDIDEFKINELSLMPEGLEKQLTPQEIVDLFAFLILDKHPKEKSAKRLPGVD